MARKRVYAAAGQTPLHRIELPVAAQVWLKREDLSPINAYKWRGAYNCMAQLTPEQRHRGVVCASAGNHAQGVALAAQRLGVPAAVFMPTSTPRMKHQAVQRLGGDVVDVHLVGDTFDAAKDAALALCDEQARTFVHPYDDLQTMGGQGTLADEIVMSGEGPFDVAYLQIGGGGMAAAVACWLKAYYPGICIVGVEGVEQASMAAAVAAGHPVTLDYVDVFCDGTAVKRAGEHTYPLCRDLIDTFVQVSNEEVCAAIELLWQAERCIAEPSGAMGIAGLMKQADQCEGQRVLTILCGANMDFERLAWVARHAGIGAARRRYFRLELAEQPGGLLHVLDEVLGGINIIDMQYGKLDEARGWPVIGFEASPPELALFEQRMQAHHIAHEEVTSEADVDFRIINYEPALFHNPYLVTLEFPERPGALRDFLLALRDATGNICYFNYLSTGEHVGRALIGFEFDDAERRAAFIRKLDTLPYAYQALSPTVLGRAFDRQPTV